MARRKDYPAKRGYGAKVGYLDEAVFGPQEQVRPDGTPSPDPADWGEPMAARAAKNRRDRQDAERAAFVNFEIAKEDLEPKPDFMADIREHQMRIWDQIGPPGPPLLPPLLADFARRKGGVEGVDFREMDLDARPGVEPSPPDPCEALLDEMRAIADSMPMALPGPGVSVTYVGRIGDRLKELGVQPQVLTRHGVKYLAIPLKELTLAEGGTWTELPRPPRNRNSNRKGTQK